ncbi:MAG: DUF308 domain-containing protein [Methanoregula sp.]|nr:DUF308 domain-containing protein [Methanoregula sp.]
MTETPATNETMAWCSQGLYPWWLILLWGILALIIGAMFLGSPAITTVLFITLLGAYWFVGGIFSLISLAVDRTNAGWKIVLGILNLILGIIVLALPLYSTVILLTLLIIFVGVWAFIMGAIHLYQGLTAKDAGNAILGIISLIFGILLLVSNDVFPLITIAMLPFIAGFIAIIVGICAIVVAFAVRKNPVVQTT